MNFLPYLAITAFFFNIFWSEPAFVLSKEYELAHYYFSSPPLIIALACAVAIAFLNWILPKKSRVWFYGGIAYILIASALFHNVLPYNYHGFVSNENFQTQLSLLGFSKWYYVLDILILGGTAVICIFLTKKQLLNPVFVFFLIFYISQSAIQFQTFRFSKKSVNISRSITLSNNHSNVLYIIYDSTPSILIEHLTKNVWTSEQKAWTKDFTLYDNAAGIGVGSTTTGLPTIFGGYAFTPQNHLKKVSSGYMTEAIYNNPEYREKYQPYPVAPVLYFFTMEALQSLQVQLPDTAISYDYFLKSKFSTPTKVESIQPLLPFTAVSLYSRAPYFLRSFFVNRDNSNQWDYHWRSRAGWLAVRSDNIELKVEETSKPVLTFAHFSGTHDALDSQASFEATATEMTSDLNDIITYLKQKNIYNSTKIILSSDHGNHSHSLGGKEAYLHSISPEPLKKFYETGTDLEKMRAFHLPVLLMIKDFGTSQAEMTTDSRFISLADMHGTLLNAFGNRSLPDYTQIMPPKRYFNIPYIMWEHIYKLVMDTPLSYYTDALYGPKTQYLELHSIKQAKIYIRELSSTNDILSQQPFEELR